MHVMAKSLDISNILRPSYRSLADSGMGGHPFPLMKSRG